jgi:hypothetical protein
MSFEYYVAVHRDKWPTAKALQAALESLGYPVSLASAADAALSAERHKLPVTFEGRPVALEAEIEPAADVADPKSEWGHIAKCVAPNFAIRDGDPILVLTFRSDADEIRAGLYVAAAMIRAFDGCGFENQYETHGRIEFADQLVAEASDASAFED